MLKPGTRGLLLVVDADSGTRAVLTDFLRGVGYTTAEASSGPRALQMVREGMNAAATVCDSPEFVSGLPRPVLLLTGSPGESRGEAENSLARPFQLVDFGDRVLRLLKDHPRKAV